MSTDSNPGGLSSGDSPISNSERLHKSLNYPGALQ
jgi:hypothetical protein